MKQRIQIAFLLSALLAISQLTEGKRTLSGGSRKSSSSSSGYNARRTSSSSSGSSVTRPAQQQPSNSHADVAKLSYPNYNSQPNRPATGGTGSNSAPIGWNVPNTNQAAKPPSYNQANPGPPPAYSPQNVPGGAHSNMHEPPPVYKPPVQAAPPSYPGNQPAVAASYPKQQSSYPQQAAGVGAAGAAYPQNTGLNTPIKAQTVRPVMSSYPHGSGQQQASYPQQGSYPQQNYHPSYPQQHGFPAGGSYANYPPPQGPPVFAGAGVQPGFYPAGSFPVQQKSSGPGLGTGLIAGAIGGAILGHALTPSHTHTVQAAPPVSSGSDHDRVIIINNTPGQPATVVTNGDASQVAGQPGGITPVGVGMVNAQPPPPQMGQQYPQQMGQQYPPQQPAGYNPGVMQPGQVAPMPGAVPVNPPVQGGPYADGTVPLAPFPDGNNNLAGMPPNNMTSPDQQQQPTYGVMCVPVLKNVTHPENPANVTQVEEVQCFNVEQPPPGVPGAPGAPPAPIQPGMPQQQPGMPPNVPQDQAQNVMKIGPQQQSNDMNNFPQQKGSTASWAENNKVTVNSGGFNKNSGSLGILASTVVALLASYCFH